MQYDNCVFLFMSSKDIYKFEEMLIEAKNLYKRVNYGTIINESRGMFMTTMDICYCVLILAGAFCLVALGVLFIRTSTAIKQTGDTVEMAQDTLKRVDKVLDDVNYKLDLLNAPVETVAKIL